MGWTVYHRENSPTTLEEERREIRKILRPYEVLSCRKIGSVWYVAAHGPVANGPSTYQADADGNATHAVVILTSRRDGEWGYKDMCECMGPQAAKAPLSILDKLSPLDADSPSANYATEWRQKCRDYAARYIPAVGDTLELKQAAPFNFGPVKILRKIRVPGRRNTFEAVEYGGRRVRLDSSWLEGCTKLGGEE